MRYGGKIRKPGNVVLKSLHNGGATAHILTVCEHVPQFQRTTIIFVAGAALGMRSLYLTKAWLVVADVGERR